MNILLDTHYLLWSVFDASELTKSEQQLLLNSQNSIIISVVSLWEIALKYQLGKLAFHGITPAQLPDVIEQAGFEIIPLQAADAASFHHLPRQRHADPFDWMLAWQAIRQDYYLLTRDTQLREYQQYGLQLL